MLEWRYFNITKCSAGLFNRSRVSEILCPTLRAYSTGSVRLPSTGHYLKVRKVCSRSLMVEGPGCKLKGERLARLKGQRLVRTQWGRNRPKDATKGSGAEQEDTTSEQSDLGVGLPLSNVETLGKELFVYFGDSCLRVHFGMNGSIQIKGHKNKAFQKTSEPVLTLTLTLDSVSFHDCTVQIRSTANCHEKYLQFQHLDVCSRHFSLAQATRAVSCHGDRMLCDVLLDQSVLPGVGNIIKNEALFDSGLQPSLKVLQLKEEHVKHLVKMTRDFSMLFYKCRKEGRALSRHCKVYKQQWCGQCQGRITVCRMGENGRMTYFCEQCQTRDPETIINNKRILPTKNSLIGWVTAGGHSIADSQEWTCSICTLINKGKAGMCSACGSPRPAPSTGDLSDTEWTCSQCTLLNDGDTTTCLVCQGPRSEPENSQEQFQGVIAVSNGDSVHSSSPPVPDGTAPPFNTQVSRKRKLPGSSGVIVAEPTTPASGKLARLESVPLTSPSGRRRVPSAAIGFNSDAAGNRLERPQHEITFHSNGSEVAQGTGGSNTVVRCKQHDKVCAERTARKKGDNYGRPFYCCSLPRGKQCKFFQWADDHFPLCNHGNRCVKRTVLKQGANNGRDFYTCRLERGKQCNFFQWV